MSNTRTTFLRRSAVAAALLVAASGLGPLSSASAESVGPELGLAALPEGPAADLPIADSSPGVNVHQVSNIAWSTGDTWADVTFVSTAPAVTAQFSTTQPKTVNGMLTMGAASVEFLQGAAIGGGQYRYTMSRDGLVPATMYHLLVNIPGAPGQSTNQAVSFQGTRVRHVRMSPVSLHVIADGDGGLKGAGELVFGFRVAPDAAPYAAGPWGSWTSEKKYHDGANISLVGLGHGHEVTTRANSVVVQVQGQENDVWGAGDFGCGLGFGALPAGYSMVPQQGSNSCFETAFAEGAASMPTGRYQGTTSQIVDVAVSRTPAVRFTAKVLVEVWYE